MRSGYQKLLDPRQALQLRRHRSNPPIVGKRLRWSNSIFETSLTWTAN